MESGANTPVIEPEVRPVALYGYLAEFEDAEALLNAARRTRDAGYHQIDAYTPFPVDGLGEALGFPRTAMPLIVLLGGIIGGVSGYLMEWYSATIAYPINVGGRPLHSWPAFIPITFELTVLCAALAGVIGMLALNRLPEPYHPLFAEPSFSRASSDRFFLCIMAVDGEFDLVKTREFMESLGAPKVTPVPEPQQPEELPHG